jgi:hypothetical protein
MQASYSSGEVSAPRDWKFQNLIDMTAIAYYGICGKLW